MKKSTTILLGLLAIGLFYYLNEKFVKADSNENLAACWEMDDNLATTNVIDTSGEGNHGTFTDSGGDPNTDAHSVVSLHQRGFIFDGTDDWFSVPDDVTINDMVVYYRSYSIWFKANDTSTRQMIYKEGGTSNGFSFYLEGNNLYYGFWGTAISDIWSNTAFTDTASWHYLQFTFDSVAGIQKGYLDGVEVASSSSTGNVPGHVGNISIGNSDGGAKYHDGDDANDRYFEGQIDEIRIYNRTLSVEEIELYYFLGSETRLKNYILKNCEIK